MPTYTFAVRRSGNLAVPCSVPWQLEGTGALPIPGSAFPGGVLPSGVADFAAGVVLAEPSFTLLEGDRPPLSQSGRLLLRNPVGCKLDPAADRHDLTLQGDDDTPLTGGTFPYGPWWVWQRATSGANRKPVGTAQQLRDAIRDAASGHQILLPAGGNISLGGDLVIDKAVSGADAYYIATDTDSDDPASFCGLSGGDIVIDGAKQLVMNGIKQVGKRLRPHRAERCQFERFAVSAVENNHESSSYGADAWFHAGIKGRPGFKVENIMVGFVNYVECTASFIDQDLESSPIRALFTHIHLHEVGVLAKVLQPGRNPSHGLLDTQSIFQYSLDTDPRRSGGTDWCEFKTNGWIVQHNTIYDNAQVKIRHGRITSRPGVGGPAKGNLFLGNLWISSGPDCTIRGAYHEFRNNWCITSGVPRLDSPLGNGQITPWVGVSNGKTFPETEGEEGGNNRLVSGYAMRAGGNRGFKVVPIYHSRGDPQFKPADCIATNSGGGRNSSVTTGDNNWGSGNDFNTRLADADIDRIPVMMTENTTGCRAWRKQFAEVYRP